MNPGLRGDTPATKRLNNETSYLTDNIHCLHYKTNFLTLFNLFNVELNTICPLLALFGAHHILHISRIRVKATVAVYCGKNEQPQCGGKLRVTIVSEGGIMYLPPTSNGHCTLKMAQRQKTFNTTVGRAVWKGNLMP